MQGQCEPSAIELARIAEAMPVLADGTCFRRQRYGDFGTPTIAMIWHSIYHKFGISPKNIKKSSKIAVKNNPKS